MRRILLGCVVAGMLCALSVAADAPLLPEQFGQWQAKSPSTFPSIFEFGGDLRPDALKEAGVAGLEQRAYASGNEKVQLALHIFKDPSGAYEFYSLGLNPNGRPLTMGDEAVSGMGYDEVLIGNFVLIARHPGDLAFRPESLGPLIPILRGKADSTPYPPLRSYLPTTRRVFGTERYAQGKFGFENAMTDLGLGSYTGLSKEVGFQDGAEAIFANYKGERGSGTLVLLEYPTPQLAEQHLHHLEQALPDELKKRGVTVERKASLLSVVFAATSAEYARAIRDSVNYETQVTWNERGQKATEPPIMLMMYKIFLFTGLFLGVATGVGIAFGGFRVIVKRLFPGKVFDRPENIEVLQLGLSGKKIDPTDMY